MGGGGPGCVAGDEASGFGPGRGRPWGRVARVFLRSKVKVSEWRIFGVERLLGAANGDEPKRGIRGCCAGDLNGADGFAFEEFGVGSEAEAFYHLGLHLL